MKIYSRKKKYTLADAVAFFTSLILKKYEVKNAKEAEISFGIFANDVIGRNINLFGYYEHEELKFIFEFLTDQLRLKQKGTALDIGANIGNHSVFFKKHFDEVFSFEPHPLVYKLLDFNIGQCEGITGANYGLGANNETREMFETPANKGGGTILQQSNKHRSKNRKKLSIEVKRLDSLTFHSIDLIKIDVEGFEQEVIYGGKETIKKYKPIILFEQNPDDFVDGVSKTAEAIKELGYNICWIDGAHPRFTGNFSRLLYIIRKLIFGLDLSIIEDDTPPVRGHTFLIALPIN